jgi:hypothetical protein
MLGAEYYSTRLDTVGMQRVADAKPKLNPNSEWTRSLRYPSSQVRESDLRRRVMQSLGQACLRIFGSILSIYFSHQNDENNSFFFSRNLSYSFCKCCCNPPHEDVFLIFRRSNMSPVVDAPESLPATALPTVDDAPVCGSPTTAPSSWWRALLSRFNQPLLSIDGSKPPHEAAIDYLAREHTFLYMKALSG